MLVCVPTSNDAGLEGVVHGHFGSAPYFTLVNTDSQEIAVVENRNAHHSHGTCHPMNQLAKFKIDTVLCSGMGRRAVETLNAKGIKTMISGEGSVKEAMVCLNDGTAKEIDPRVACQGHGHHHHYDDSLVGGDFPLKDRGVA